MPTAQLLPVPSANVIISALCFSSSVIFLLVDACVGLNWLLVSFLSHVNKNIIHSSSAFNSHLWVSGSRQIDGVCISLCFTNWNDSETIMQIGYSDDILLSRFWLRACEMSHSHRLLSPLHVHSGGYFTYLLATWLYFVYFLSKQIRVKLVQSILSLSYSK